MRCLPTVCPGAKIVLVGEAPGQQEELLGEPFLGESGNELTRMLAEAGIERSFCTLTNVFMNRPEKNDLTTWCASKKECLALDPTYNLPALKQGKYLLPEYRHELDRLHQELLEWKPNIIVALGGTALWALTRLTGITKIRGTILGSPYGKVLATFHPAYILRVWSDRSICVQDLMKAKAQSEFPELRRMNRRIHVDPTLDDLVEWERILTSARLLSVDTETRGDTITLIGFAPSPTDAYVLPFLDSRRPDYSYWPTPEDEKRALLFMARVLSCPVPKLFQNGMYDLQYIWFAYKMIVRNCEHDTLLMHHSMYPELPKSLGFLGSVYSDEAPWKLMRGGSWKRED